MLHYNFPPFSVGECGRIGTGRREIGHGNLAWRAINSSLTCKRKFSLYIKSCFRNNQSLTALHQWQLYVEPLYHLMDAGVPIKEPVAGIAMGLIKEGKNFQFYQIF